MSKIKTAVAATAVAAGAVLGTGVATAAPAPGPAVVQADSCPTCGANFGDDDAGAEALAEHLAQFHWRELQRVVDDVLGDVVGTGSAG